MNNLITVGIPVYNGEKFIAKTLESIINQTYKNLEIIVSDNLSTDSTINIVKEFMAIDKRIKLNINPINLGFSGNLNKIIELSNAEYIALYHADDIYEPTIVEEQVKFLNENTELAGCFTLGKVIDELEKPIKNDFVFTEKKLKNNLKVNLDFFVKKFLENGNIFICPTSMIKKSVYLELGKYDKTLKYIEDQDMWMRILEKYNLGIVAKELINYRVHSQQGSSYYTDKTRKDLIAYVTHLVDFLNKENNNSVKEKYLKDINKFISKDYITISKNMIFLNRIEESGSYLKLSRSMYKFPVFSKYWIFQHLNNPLIRFLYRTIKKNKG